jgi:hypothetical protein
MSLFPLGLEQSLYPLGLNPLQPTFVIHPTICIPAVAIEDQTDVLAISDLSDVLDTHEAMEVLDIHEAMKVLTIHDASDSLELTEDLPTASIIPGCEA